MIIYKIIGWLGGLVQGGSKPLLVKMLECRLVRGLEIGDDKACGLHTEELTTVKMAFSRRIKQMQF